MDIVFEPLTLKTIPHYMEVGIQSYKEHYTNLWKNGDCSSYIHHSFTEEVVKSEVLDTNVEQYIIKTKFNFIGILKLVIDEPVMAFTAKEAILAEKIYLKNAFTGKGIGKQIVNFLEDRAFKIKKRIIGLDTMKKGRAKNFYQKHGYKIIGASEITLPGILEKEKEMWVMGKLIE